MKIEVLGIFQWEYYPIWCIHCTSVLFSLLGLITPDASLTNHPKWNRWNILMVRMFNSTHALTVNSTVGKKQKQKSKLMSDSIRIRHIREQVLFNIRKSLKAWAWRLQIHFISLANNLRQISKQLYQATFWCMSKSHYSWIFPRNSYDTPRNSYVHSYMMNPDAYHDEPRWRSSRTQQHFEVHPWSECSPRFSSKSPWDLGHMA